MQNLDVDRRRGLRLRAEHRRRALHKLAAPLRDLVRMHVELLRQLGQRLVAPDGRYRHLRLKCRTVSVRSDWC